MRCRRWHRGDLSKEGARPWVQCPLDAREVARVKTERGHRVWLECEAGHTEIVEIGAHDYRIPVSSTTAVQPELL